MDYEIIGKMFITITKILFSIFGFWGTTLFIFYLYEEKKWKYINFIGLIIGIIWSWYTIWN